MEPSASARLSLPSALPSCTITFEDNKETELKECYILDNLIDDPISSMEIEKYSFTPMWNFNTIVNEIKKQILQFIPFAVIRLPSNYKEIFVTYSDEKQLDMATIIQFNPFVFHMRLISQSWNTVLNEVLLSPVSYYIRFARQQIPLQMQGSRNDNLSNQILYISHLRVVFNKIKRKEYHDKETSRVKSNMKHIISVPFVWKTMASFIFLCLVCFFVLQTLQNVLQWSIPVLDIYIQYLIFVNIIPLLLCFFSLPCFLGMVGYLDNAWRSFKSFSTWVYMGIAIVIPLCLALLMNSFIVLYALNSTVLQSYVIAPTEFGRRELVPWPVVFSPLYLLFGILWVIMLGVNIYAFVYKCFIHKIRDYHDFRNFIYLPFVMFLLISCMLAFIISVSITMEFPVFLNPSYAYIFLFLFQLVLLVVSIESTIFDRNLSRYLKYITPINCILIFVPISFFFNHILVCIASFGLLPMSTVYITMIVPWGLFYLWIILRLQSKYKNYWYLDPKPAPYIDSQFISKGAFGSDIFENSKPRASLLLLNTRQKLSKKQINSQLNRSQSV